MEKDETLEEMVNRITDENFHEEIFDGDNEWLDLEVDFTLKFNKLDGDGKEIEEKKYSDENDKSMEETTIREGWAESALQTHIEGDDNLRMDFPNKFDDTLWTWQIMPDVKKDGHKN